MTRKTFNTPIFVLAALCAAAPAFALESDSRQPIQIEADQGSLDQANQVTTFSGNVIIKQGSINIRAGSVKVSRNDKGQQFMTASGSPVKFSQTLDGNKGTVHGQANKVDYTSASSVVTLTGNAKVTRGGDVAQGSVITYNTKTEVYTILGSKASGGKASSTKSGRVSVVIQPSSTSGRKK